MNIRSGVAWVLDHMKSSGIRANTIADANPAFLPKSEEPSRNTKRIDIAPTKRLIPYAVWIPTPKIAKAIAI